MFLPRKKAGFPPKQKAGFPHKQKAGLPHKQPGHFHVCTLRRLSFDFCFYRTRLVPAQSAPSAKRLSDVRVRQLEELLCRYQLKEGRPTGITSASLCLFVPLCASASLYSLCHHESPYASHAQSTQFDFTFPPYISVTIKGVPYLFTPNGEHR